GLVGGNAQRAFGKTKAISGGVSAEPMGCRSGGAGLELPTRSPPPEPTAQANLDVDRPQPRRTGRVPRIWDSQPSRRPGYRVPQDAVTWVSNRPALTTHTELPGAGPSLPCPWTSSMLTPSTKKTQRTIINAKRRILTTLDFDGLTHLPAPSAAPRLCLCSPASLVPSGVSPQAAPASSGEGPALHQPPTCWELATRSQACGAPAGGGAAAAHTTPSSSLSPQQLPTRQGGSGRRQLDPLPAAYGQAQRRPRQHLPSPLENPVGPGWQVLQVGTYSHVMWVLRAGGPGATPGQASSTNSPGFWGDCAGSQGCTPHPSFYFCPMPWCRHALPHSHLLGVPDVGPSPAQRCITTPGRSPSSSKLGAPGAKTAPTPHVAASAVDARELEREEPRGRGRKAGQGKVGICSRPCEARDAWEPWGSLWARNRAEASSFPRDTTPAFSILPARSCLSLASTRMLCAGAGRAASGKRGWFAFDAVDESARWVRLTAGAQPGVRLTAGAQPGVRLTAGAQPGVRLTAGAQTGVRLTAGAQTGVRLTAGAQPGPDRRDLLGQAGLVDRAAPTRACGCTQL
ncbi:hypothetical protein EI555_000369, partial [Monodon monoceros]